MQNVLKESFHRILTTPAKDLSQEMIPDEIGPLMPLMKNLNMITPKTLSKVGFQKLVGRISFEI